MLRASGSDNAVARFKRNPDAAIDAGRAREGGFGGGIFAVWIPSHDTLGLDFDAMADVPFHVPLPPEVPIEEALPEALRQMSILFRLERAGLLRVCRTAAEIEASFADGILAAVLHFEGAEAVGPDLAALDVYHAAGLRSLGPVWSRPNRFGCGVPFSFPASPDSGPGLTAAGKALVRRCNALGIMVDLSHISEAGFWEVARLTEKPLVASHSNAHALCASARNLTDAQLDAIAETGGLVGLNFATAFLRADGRMKDDVPLSRLVEHLDYLLDRLGEGGVALGSDYDGAMVPRTLAAVEHLPRLVDAMADRGYGEALIRKICHENWLRVMRATWGG